jgi:hypothetical protein
MARYQTRNCDLCGKHYEPTSGRQRKCDVCRYRIQPLPVGGLLPVKGAPMVLDDAEVSIEDHPALEHLRRAERKRRARRLPRLQPRPGGITLATLRELHALGYTPHALAKAYGFNSGGLWVRLTYGSHAAYRRAKKESRTN